MDDIILNIIADYRFKLAANIPVFIEFLKEQLSILDDNDQVDNIDLIDTIHENCQEEISIYLAPLYDQLARKIDTFVSFHCTLTQAKERLKIVTNVLKAEEFADKERELITCMANANKANYDTMNELLNQIYFDKHVFFELATEACENLKDTLHELIKDNLLERQLQQFKLSSQQVHSCFYSTKKAIQSNSKLLKSQRTTLTSQSCYLNVAAQMEKNHQTIREIIEETNNEISQDAYTSKKQVALICEMQCCRKRYQRTRSIIRNNTTALGILLKYDIITEILPDIIDPTKLISIDDHDPNPEHSLSSITLG